MHAAALLVVPRRHDGVAPPVPASMAGCGPSARRWRAFQGRDGRSALRTVAAVYGAPTPLRFCSLIEAPSSD